MTPQGPSERVISEGPWHSWLHNLLLELWVGLWGKGKPLCRPVERCTLSSAGFLLFPWVTSFMRQHLLKGQSTCHIRRPRHIPCWHPGQEVDAVPTNLKSPLTKPLVQQAAGPPPEDTEGEFSGGLSTSHFWSTTDKRKLLILCWTQGPKVMFMVIFSIFPSPLIGFRELSGIGSKGEPSYDSLESRTKLVFVTKPRKVHKYVAWGLWIFTVCKTILSTNQKQHRIYPVTLLPKAHLQRSTKDLHPGPHRSTLFNARLTVSP